MKKSVLSLFLITCLNVSAISQSKGDPVKYSTPPGFPSCRFFDGFADNGDGTVTDPRNGLIWKRCAEGFSWDNGRCVGGEKMINWFDAVKYAKEHVYGGKAGWRLPTSREFLAVLGPQEDSNGNDVCVASGRKGFTAASTMIAHVVQGDRDRRGYHGIFWAVDSPKQLPDSAYIFDFNYGVFSWKNEYDSVIKRAGDKASIRLVRGGGKNSIVDKSNAGLVDDIKREKLRSELDLILGQLNLVIDRLTESKQIRNLTREVSQLDDLSKRLSLVQSDLNKYPKELVKHNMSYLHEIREKLTDANKFARSINSSFHSKNLNRQGVKEISKLFNSGNSYMIGCRSSYWATVDQTTLGQYCGEAASGEFKCFAQVESLAEYICR